MSKSQTNCLTKHLKFVPRQRLGQSVSHLFVSGGILKSHGLVGDLLPAEVVADLNMLGASMRSRILGQCDCALIILVNNNYFQSIVI